MKKVGIVCDNYKIDRFKKELTSKGFTDFEIFPFTTAVNSFTTY